MSKVLMTISENAFGDLHIWFGRKHVNKSNPGNHKVNGNESPVYLQSHSEQETAREYLTFAQITELAAGYTVYTYRIPVDYYEQAYLNETVKNK